MQYEYIVDQTGDKHRENMMEEAILMQYKILKANSTNILWQKLRRIDQFNFQISMRWKNIWAVLLSRKFWSNAKIT